jgi:hypothetical protein
MRRILQNRDPLERSFFAKRFTDLLIITHGSTKNPTFNKNKIDHLATTTRVWREQKPHHHPRSSITGASQKLVVVEKEKSTCGGPSPSSLLHHQHRRAANIIKDETCR